MEYIKHVLSAPKEELQQEFELYRKSVDLQKEI
jgi:hypothetical protein